jgi:hypothetical protein
VNFCQIGLTLERKIIKFIFSQFVLPNARVRKHKVQMHLKLITFHFIRLTKKYELRLIFNQESKTLMNQFFS